MLVERMMFISVLGAARDNLTSFCDCTPAGAGVEATNEHLVAIKKCFEDMHKAESRCRTEAKLRMQVFGMLYKQGHDFRKDLKLRLWVMDGTKLTYYTLGDPKPKGSLQIHQIRSVEKYTFVAKKSDSILKMDTVNIDEMKEFALEICTYGESKNFVVIAPDAHSRDVWQDALGHKIEDNLMMQTEQGWQKRWLVVHKSEIAVFEEPGGETIGIIELKHLYPGSLKKMEMEGKSHCFALETTEDQYVFTASDATSCREWMKTIGELLATRGTDEEVGAYLAAVKSGSAVEANSDSPSMEDAYLTSLSATLRSGAPAEIDGRTRTKTLKTVDVKHPLYKTIMACQHAEAKARVHSDMGFIASASVQLTLMLVHLAQEVSCYPNQDEKEVTVLRNIFDKLKVEEDRLKTLGQRDMLVYGMLYKKADKRKNWQVRLFVLDGGTIKYYQLGEAEPKGEFELATIGAVDTTPLDSTNKMAKLIMLGMDSKDPDSAGDGGKPWKKFCMKLHMDGQKHDYQACAPNEASQKTWVQAFTPVYQDTVRELTMGEKYNQRLCVLHKSQITFFEQLETGSELDKSLLKEFKKADKDKSGALDKAETKKLMKKMGFPAGDDFDDLFSKCDRDGNGEITQDEFEALHTYVQSRRGRQVYKISLKNVKSIARDADVVEEGHDSMPCCTIQWNRDNGESATTKVLSRDADKLVDTITHLITARVGAVKEANTKLSKIVLKMKGVLAKAKAAAAATAAAAADGAAPEPAAEGAAEPAAAAAEPEPEPEPAAP